MSQVPTLDLLQQIIQEYQKILENEHLNMQFINEKSKSFHFKIYLFNRPFVKKYYFW